MEKIRSFCEFMKNIWLLIKEIREQRKVCKFYFHHMFDEAMEPNNNYVSYKDRYK